MVKVIFLSLWVNSNGTEGSLVFHYDSLEECHRGAEVYGTPSEAMEPRWTFSACLRAELAEVHPAIAGIKF